jgi:hypothetical protein
MPKMPGSHAEVVGRRRIQDEQALEAEVEQVQRRGREDRRAHDRVAEDELEARRSCWRIVPGSCSTGWLGAR